MVSQYNKQLGEKSYGVTRFHTLINKRAHMEGFIIGDYRENYSVALKDLTKWVKQGQIKYKEDTLLHLFLGGAREQQIKSLVTKKDNTTHLYVN